MKETFSSTLNLLTSIVPWFFSLDHTHYARWIPIHLRDMISLKDCHFNVYEAFMRESSQSRKPGMHSLP